MPISSEAVAGTNATAPQYNNLRTDAITRTRIYVFEIPYAVIVGDEQGGRFLIQEGGTVTAIKHKLGTGTATIRVQKNTTDVDSGISVTSSAGEETAITTPAVSEDQVLTLDVTAASSDADKLLVQVQVEYTV